MEIIAFVFMLFFFCLSIFYSGMETGMISIDRFRLEQDAKTDNRKKKLLKFLENPNTFLSITLIGNNIAIVVVSTLFAIYFADKLPFSRSMSTLALAGMLLIFAEIIPKSYCRDNAENLVSKFYPLLFFSYLIFKPFIIVLDFSNSLIAKIFNIDSSNSYGFLSREDLSIILAETSLDESIEQPQRDMLEEVMDFNELTAKNVMTPRLDIVAIKSDTHIDEIITIAQKEGYSRYPVYENTVDNIIGILIIYDLINQNERENLTAKNFLREALFVPETTDINSLLKEMQTGRKSMAIVVDSFGGTSGLVTTEDILEELVGEIEDEYDLEANDDIEIKQLDENTYLVKGDIEIDYLNDNYDINLPEGDYETIAGLIIEQISRIPHKGQKIIVNHWTLEVLQANSTKIIQVKMFRLNK